MPNQMLPEPTDAEWQRLYQAALQFQEQAPWTRLTDADLFAVERPETGDAIYCAVMGAAGLEYGLLACRGARGLLAYLLMANDALDSDEAVLVQDSLSLTFGDRSDSDEADRAVHAALSLRFRGRGAWPVFRSHRPHYLPSHLRQGEASFLATCLEQTCLLAHEIGSGLLLQEPPGDNEVFVRRQNEQGNWETTAMSLPSPTLDMAIDERRLNSIVGNYERIAQSWEVRLLAVVPIAGEDDGQDFWGRILLCVDHKTGFVWPTGVLGPNERVQDAFLAALESAGFVPKTLRLTSGLLEAQLSPIAQVLGIEVRRVAELPELEAASASLMSALPRIRR